MKRIAGIELKDNWRMVYALTNIRGISWSLSRKILDDSKVGREKRVKDVTDKEISKITKSLADHLTGGDLFRTIKTNVSRLQSTGTYRGRRHSAGLPTRGQRTRSNARTRRGKRKTVGSFKKEDLTKQQQS
ncbi:ribosomal protein uS13 [Patescibacteria group bacterium]